MRADYRQQHQRKTTNPEFLLGHITTCKGGILPMTIRHQTTKYDKITKINKSKRNKRNKDLTQILQGN